MRALTVLCLLLAVLIAPAAAESIGDVVETFPAPGCCAMGMSADGEFLYVVDRNANKIFKVNGITGDVDSELPTPSFRPTGLAWAGDYLWVADRDKNQIFRIAIETGIVDRVHDLPYPAPKGLAWDGEYLYLADAKKDMIYCLDPEDGTLIRSFPTPSGAPTGLAHDGMHLWMADRDKDEIYMIDPARGEVIGILPSPGPHPWGLAWDGRNLWNADYQTRKLYRINITEGDPVLHFEEKKLRISYNVHFFSQGPDPLLTTDIYVAIPENRYNQKLIGDPVFTPEPTEVLVDQYGQKIAHFERPNLPAGAVFEPRYRVDVSLYRTRIWIIPEKVGTRGDIPEEIRAQYLTDARKYRLDHPAIQMAVKKAIGDETNLYWIARKLYRYVMDKLDYKIQGGWDAAPILLERGTGSCSEYSFVMIALCRAAGIPARYVGGVVTRGDDSFVDNVFHRWVEIYLPGYGWIPVDPDRGDRRSTRGQAMGFGFQDNTLLVTTESGGDSEYLHWKYNSRVHWTFKGQARVHTEEIGELAKLDEEEN